MFQSDKGEQLKTFQHALVYNTYNVHVCWWCQNDVSSVKTCRKAMYLETDILWRC